jgi:hypothetical protein
MKKALLILTILGLVLSPVMVSQAQAATPAKHHRVVKHEKKHLKKKFVRHNVRKHKVAV